ncbi:nose resistant to fluoxetine protein 6 [Drosophila sulfurigaster albostrigata]|uniref:nose resistant to fluoxetine protein 6 n=1 Tax=Drosophila sulfurigaster albostrigata TaxID=89887 RepID=UPI002D219290|nr:nose resistant to fluoxetine protein 6 [Drosophila sulfurigaster albostrigata]
MPAMYQLDDYDLCLQQSPSQILAHSTYCLVYTEIVPNASSTLWQQIEQFSQDNKHHFRHDHLFVGVCLERCKRALHTLSRFQKQQLYEGKVVDTELSSYYAKVHKRAADERIRYEHVINSCLNRDFDRRFELRVRSSIEYCERADEQLAHDALDITVYCLLASVLLLTIFSSFYDYRLKLQQTDPQLALGNLFYQQQLKSSLQGFLTIFSLCRNYYRLVLPSRSQFSKDLRFFDAFRVIGVFVVILGHTLMVFMTVQIQNPEFYEQFLYKFEASIFQNGSAFIQIFFVMSSFLLYVNFTERQWINNESGVLTCIGVYFRVFFTRYFRMLPSLVMLILCNATILSRLGDGPFWRHLTEAERIFCRSNWWKNVFFVNNYLLEESCAQQTWYMGADMQLFELFLILIIIMKKHPGLTRIIYVVLFFMTFCVPAFLTYFLKLEAVYHIMPETYRYLYFRNSETFYEIYPPFYTNLGGYFMGLLCGQFYLKFRSTSRGGSWRGKWSWQLSMWLLIPAALLVLLSGFIFIKHDFEKPSIWLALYAGIYKNLWIMICGGFVCCMCFKVGWIAYEFCCLPIFRPLGRISFQAFIWHVFILRLVAGYFRDPVYVNSFFLFGNVLLVFVLTQIVAFFMALLLEYPLVELLKLLTHHKPVPKKEEYKISTVVQFELTTDLTDTRADEKGQNCVA